MVPLRDWALEKDPRSLDMSVARLSLPSVVGAAACAEALADGACSADVVLNILARHRQPEPVPSIPTPEGLHLRHQPVADCHRYDRLREVGHGAS